MKKNILLLLFFAVVFSNTRIYAQLQSIPDANFRNHLMSKFPDCFSGNLLDISCEKVLQERELDVSNLGITDLTGTIFFKSLQSLKCYKNNLTTLDGVLPDSLRFLDCRYNLLTSLPTLPDSLQTLQCSNNQLSALPVLPTIMDLLHCTNNKLTQLPNLPNTFSSLAADSNKLTSLPPIPDSLRYISVVNNELTIFPAVSTSANKIYYINVSTNKITQVPSLPTSLNFLLVAENFISELPALPSGLLSLGCSNNQISCLPFLPIGLRWLGFKANPITCIPNMPLNLSYFSGTTTDICTAANTSTNNCTYYLPITGTAYVDYNSNNIQDLGETGVADVLISATNDMLPKTITDNLGNFTLYLPAGNYAYRAFPIDSLFTSPSVRVIKIVGGTSNSTSPTFGLIPTATEYKVAKVSATAKLRPRPGFPASYVITYTNVGNYPISNAELSFSYASQFTYQSTSLPFTSYHDTTLVWSIPVINPGQKKNITVDFMLPASVPLGTDIPVIAVLTPINKGDTTLNYCILHNEARGSYDPNDKNVLPEGTVTPDFIATQKNLTYTIRFQNTGTADAVNVVVIDTISNKLDIETLTLISSSHPYRYEQRGNKAAWVFENIHLPDMHTNEQQSHGYITFSIKPMPNLVVGDVITNRAGIVFDYNETVITNTTETKITIPSVTTSTYSQTEQSTKMNVYPNPSADKVYLTFNTQTYSGNASILIRNNLNQEVASQSAALVKGTNTLELDIDALNAGIYFIEVIYGSEHHTAKLLKR